jgi:transposase
MPRSPGHVFYDRLQEVLIAGGFNLLVERASQSYYAPKLGAPVDSGAKGNTCNLLVQR